MLRAEPGQGAALGRKKIKHICRAVDSSHPAPQRFWTNAGHGIQHQERFFQPHIEVD
jgi:hypothetical protein